MSAPIKPPAQLNIATIVSLIVSGWRVYVLGGGQVQGRYEHYEFQRAIREAGSAAGFPKK